MTCKDCKFWEPAKGAPVLAENNAKEQGVCHCEPPKATPVVMPEVNKITGQVIPRIVEFTVWPITFSEGWCGKFEKAEVVEEVAI